MVVGPLLAACRPTDGERRRTHPLDPKPSLMSGSYTELSISRDVHCGMLTPEFMARVRCRTEAPVRLTYDAPCSGIFSRQIVRS